MTMRPIIRSENQAVSQVRTAPRHRLSNTP